MAGLRTRCYVHTPDPPFSRIAGPIFASIPSRNWGLSQDSGARLQIPGADILEEWIRPGMCWVVDDSALGEPLWAGFVNEQSIPLNADQIDIDLIGPKRALLEIEMAVRLPMNSTRAYAIQRAIESAQTRHGGIQPGEIDPTEGVATPIEVRGETVSDFINTVKSETGGEWRERVEPLAGGGELIFYLDFGTLKRSTGITLGRRDLVDGLFTRERIPASFTFLSSAAGFEEREAAVASIETGATGIQENILTVLEEDARDKLQERLIGPAAAYHSTQISERIGGDLASYGRVRHKELLDRIDEVFLTVDMSRTNPQSVRLGDVFRLDVQDWGAPLSIVVDVKLHVFNTEINADAGTRILECRVVE